jgi:hypothetical protein
MNGKSALQLWNKRIDGINSNTSGRRLNFERCFVPRLLMPDRKYLPAASHVEFVEVTDDDRNVLERIVTDDESSCFMYDPETQRQDSTWLSTKKPKIQKKRMQSSWAKTNLTALFHPKGIIHHDCMSEK